jgi:hypothetical protein
MTAAPKKQSEHDPSVVTEAADGNGFSIGREHGIENSSGF